MEKHTEAHTHIHIEHSSVAIMIRKRQNHPSDLPGPTRSGYQPLLLLWLPFLLLFSPFTPYWSTHYFYLRAFTFAGPSPGMLFPQRNAWLASSNPSRLHSVTFAVRPTLSPLFKTATSTNINAHNSPPFIFHQCILYNVIILCYPGFFAAFPLECELPESRDFYLFSNCWASRVYRTTPAT